MDPNEKQPSNLFVTNADVLLEEDPNITPVIIDCMTYVREKLEEQFTYFVHPSFGNREHTHWPKTVSSHCLHCCHPFDTIPVPIPRRYDDRLNKYFVFGIFCSINCAKAYILEHEPAISTTRMLTFSTMCREVFGLREPVKPAPPRIMLQCFGGSLTIEQFRKSFKYVTSISIEPPFLQNSMLLREEKITSTNSKTTILPETKQQRTALGKTSHVSVSAFTPASTLSTSSSLFSKFITEHKEESSLPEIAHKPKKHKSESSTKKGNLNAFVTFT
jgi:hypothetical protein